MKTKNEKSLVLFETFRIRRHYDEEKEIWYFSVVDIVAALTDQKDFQVARKYWNKLSERLKSEGSEVVTHCHRMKMKAQDEKMRETDVANVETILRLVQSVPSKKAEPIKLWLAKVGYERMEEMNNPEIALNRSREYWQKKGRSEKWIQQRMLGQETRNKLTDYWGKHGIEKEDEFAILTNLIHKEWSELTVKEHKNLKGLKSQNLRDHMSEAELIFTALAELSTRQIAESEKADGFEANKPPAKKGGKIAKDARKALEQKTSKSVITEENFLPQPVEKKKLNKK